MCARVIFAADNGLNPVWPQKQFLFDVHNPTFSFLRFTVYEEDMFSDPNFLAQATCPIRLLRTGDHSVSGAVLRPRCRAVSLQGGVGVCPQVTGASL